MRFIEDGDAVVVEVVFRGRGTSSGAETTARLAHAARFRDGLIAYLGAFPDVPRACAAVGLAE